MAQRNAPTGSVLQPALPTLPSLPAGPRSSTPKLKAPELLKEEMLNNQVEQQRLKNEASEISLGSPKQKATRQKSMGEMSDVTKDGIVTGKKDDLPTSTKSGDTKAKKLTTNKPPKIQVPSAASSASIPPPSIATNEFPQDILATPGVTSALVGTPGSISHPATPGTSTPSEPSNVSARHRVMRITTDATSKVIEQTPASVTTERSSVFPLSTTKRGSRRPSLSSVQQSRPSTPGMSERPSHDASRASSPPPSTVGSAPERGKSKNQQKKDRKARKTTEVSEALSAASTPVTEEVAPVVARQTKKKKSRVESTTIASVDETASPKEATNAVPAHIVPEPTTTSTSAAPKLEQKETITPAPASKTKGKTATQVQKPSTPVPEIPREESPQMAEEVKPAYSVLDLFNETGKAAGPNADAATTHTALQKLLHDHVSSMPKIIASLLASGDLSKDHPWLNPPSFNSAAYKLAPDSRHGQEYLDGNAYSANDAFGYIYLPMKEKQALKDGNAVSVADAGERKDDLLKRCLVTPNGWVLRHLSADESEKVLELEERRQMYVEDFGEIGTMTGLGALEPDDYINATGGMPRLATQGERHGVVWIVGEDGQIDDDELSDPFDHGDAEVDGAIGVSDEEAEGLYDEGSIDDPGMPRAWESSTPNRYLAPTIGPGGRPNSLPGLGPHSKTTTQPLPLTSPNLVPDQPPSVNRATTRPNIPAAPATAPPATSNAQSDKVNPRLLENDALQKRIQETQKALDAARKDMERLDKMATKKAKDINRWREGLVGPMASAGIKG